MDAAGDDAISFSSKGSTISAWHKNRMNENDKRAPVWRQLYLSRAKLKAVSRTSALIAGFAMIAMVEVQLDSSVRYPPALLISFSVVTTCLVSVHLFALMISTCLLPNIEAISNIHTLSAVRHSPHAKMRTYIEISWVLSTGVGLILFLIEIALLIWLKFVGLCADYKCPGAASANATAESNCDQEKCVNAASARWSSMGILIPVTLLFAGFAFHFYRSLAQHKYNIFNSAMEEIKDLEMRQEDMICQARQLGASEEGGLHLDYDISRKNSALSGAVQFRQNGMYPDSLRIEQDVGANNSGRTSPSLDMFIDKSE